MRRAAAVALLLAAGAWTQELPTTATFGTTVAVSSGLQGEVYELKPGAIELPNFKRLKPVGKIYTTSLNITPRGFQTGFPGLTGRFEWFAIDYTGRFWVEQEGDYTFRLISDDGSKLYIDGKRLADNDGIHPPAKVDGSAELTRGVHTIRISYFQGPRYDVALILQVNAPGGNGWRVFDTDDFKPPPDPADWVEGKIRKVRAGANW